MVNSLRREPMIHFKLPYTDPGTGQSVFLVVRKYLDTGQHSTLATCTTTTAADLIVAALGV
ncbi:hypothetical protein PBI_CHE12_18 [Mycobacterium phage Che12]|uniref:Uncharacterized protein n=1 Tax=Mycobacterium phage Che12 TaxID=2911435 RepID=Q1A0J9_9CAUD|nr:gp18 [Mycobacterium phage Che12]ABE67337.1 hypothetical protein PBI_CHE12_18 [Mycobacterium phage Che12]